MKNILLIIGFALIVCAGVAGIPSWPRIVQSAGYFTISKNPYGVAIYQDGIHNSVEFTGASGFKIYGTTVTIGNHKNITYGRDDIVFDANGTIYTEPQIAQIDYLTQTIGKPFQPVPTYDSKISLPVPTFYILNPHVPGMLEIHTTGTTLMWIDRNLKQIGGWTNTSVTILVHDTVAI